MIDERGSILIVEDSEVEAKALVCLLDELANIAYAANGADALELFEQGDFDVVLLDIMLPDMDGFEVCRRMQELRSNTRQPSIIFVTALEDMESERQGLELGAIDYVSKPFSAPGVRARVRNHLMLSRARQDLREKNLELERLASIDPLTNTDNRRAFEEKAVQELDRVRRYGRPITLLGLDLDHFKSINDTYGHDAGDRVLKAVTVCWRDQLRNLDIIGRTGGEEFSILLPETDGVNALRVAQRLVEATRALEVELDGGETLNFTVSVGLASRMDDGLSSLDDLMKWADKALYAAKNGGRDRVVGCFLSGDEVTWDGVPMQPVPEAALMSAEARQA